MRNFVRQPSSLRHALAPRLILAALLPLLTGSASAQLLAASPEALAAGPHIFSGHTPHMVAEGQAAFIEHYDPTKMLRLTLSLNLPHPAEESQFLEDVQNKKSPLFHKYLTPEQWDARFGPSEQDEQAVVDWATSQGFTITARFPDRLLVDVEAPADVIERALHVVLNTYQLPSEEIGLPGEQGFSNDRDPVLPSSLNTIVLSVMGLNSFERVHPSSFRNNPKPPDYTPGPAKSEPESSRADAKVQPPGSPTPNSSTPDAAPSASQGSSPSENNGYFPTNIWGRGGYDTNALMRQGHCCNPYNNPDHSPVETSIAIAAYGDLNFNDLNAYQAGFPYLAFNVEKISIDGGYTCNNSPNPDDNCAEVSLDTEWSMTLANSQGSSAATAKVYVYEAASYFGDVADVYNQMVTDNYARVTSTSWACEEINCWDTGDMSTVDSILGKMAGQGWTLVVSSGDQGSTAGCGNHLAINFPGADPNMVSVGGTYLSMYYDSMQFISEGDWVGGQTQDQNTTNGKGSCKSNNGGSTGGFSKAFGVPGYQSGMGFPGRANPDISLNADYGQNYYFLGNWSGIGGTSMSAPMVAGFLAQANSYLYSLGAVCNGNLCGTLGNVNYQLYELGRNEDGPHHPYYDINTGCSSNDKTTEYQLTAFCATNGFDEATGWGTFNMLQLAWDLNFRTATANGFPDTQWTGPATNKWYNSNQNVSWTIDDYLGNAGGQPTGIAGFTQGWDSIPGDSTSRAHPDSDGNPSTDTFFTGPQFVNGVGGCLALASGEGCAGGVSQGCHTAHVRGWNNMGMTTGDTTYGPVCYDTVAPTVSLSLSPARPNSGWYTSSVKVTLTASDPGGSGASGIAHTFYTTGAACEPTDTAGCIVYGSPFTVTAQGYNLFAYFTEDNAGNASDTALFGVNIDETAPSTTSGLSGSLVGNYWQSAVTVVLTATDSLSGVAKTTYTLDGGPTTTYNGSFKVSTPGSHTITYTSTDIAGNVEATQNNTFAIQSPVNTSLSVTPSTSTAGTSVKLTATIMPTLSGGTPTGSVTFYNGSTKLGSAALSGITASLTTSTLPVGSDSLYAVYGGATYYLASTSATVTATVTSANNLSITPSLTFASTPIGTTSAAQLIQIKNVGATPITFTAASFISGTNAASFIKSASTCTNPLAAGASCTNSIEFKPTTTGTLAATVTYTDTATGSPQTVSLTGTGASAGPTLSISPASLTFPATAVGSTSAVKTITLTNTGTSPVSFTAATTITGSGASSFIKSASTCANPLAAGASCTNSIEFKPTTAGALTATITYTDTATGSPNTVALSGTGGSSGPTLSISPASLTFPATAVGSTSAVKTITLTNTGTSPVSFTAATTITGSGASSFIKSASTCANPLAAGASCTNSIEFKPTTTGTLAATITYTDTATGSPNTVALSGTGGSSGPTLSISPGSLTFPATAVGSTSAVKTITLTNTGTSPVSFTAATTITGSGAGSFIKSASTCANPLAAGASCTNSIEFKPTTAGALTATITYTDTATGSPNTVALSGTGN
jgi:hypothetical protein